MELTFLRSGDGRPLVKTFTDRGKIPYPMVKNFTSETARAKTIQDVAGQVVRASGTGQCLLRGDLDRPLENEPRKGRTKYHDAQQLCVIDFDGLDTSTLGLQEFSPPLDHADFEYIAEWLVSLLPEPFHDVSYFAQASASFGQGNKNISAHLYFVLEEPEIPRRVKQYMRRVNFENDVLEASIKLSNSGIALSYVVDPSVCDNARLIYIGTPLFQDQQVDPFREPEDRFVLVEKSSPTVRLTPAINACNFEKTARLVSEKVRDLRKAAGLRGKSLRTRKFKNDGRIEDVVSNPDFVDMQIAFIDQDFVRYNIGGGDSNAYWVHKTSPDIVYNFKDEPAFLFKEANPEAYQDHLERFLNDENIVTEDGYKPLVFQDEISASYYYGLYNPANQRMEYVRKASRRENLENFLVHYGGVMPDTVPVWRYAFEPNNPKIVDYGDNFINKYQAPDCLRSPAPIPDDAIGVEIGRASPVLATLCPTIYTFLSHMAGDGLEEIEHFLNWLAFIVQRREKTTTAWVFHGVPGSGKGQFFHHVLSPLLGENATDIKRTVDIEEKYNDWILDKLLFVVDEYRMDERGKSVDIINMLKNMISEPRGTIRSMRQDQRTEKIYANLIFFSNDRDAVKIQDGDRRFNVAPRQEMKIMDKYPDLFINYPVTRKLLKQELPQFASFLLTFNVDEQSCMLPLDNLAKSEMRMASQTTIDVFVESLRFGVLDYFIPIMELNVPMFGEDFVTPAKKTMKRILAQYGTEHPEAGRIHIRELRTMYCALCGAAEKEQKFARMLAHHGLQSKATRIGKRPPLRGYDNVKWSLREYNINELRQLYFEPAEVVPLEQKI